MRTGVWLVVLVVMSGCFDGDEPVARVGTPCPAVVIREVNDRWIDMHSDSGDNRWERATYFIGDLAAADTLGDVDYFTYALRWAERHGYEVNRGIDTRNADDHAAGQVYLAMYERYRNPAQLTEITASLDNVIASGERGDWSWIDAQFMASPTFAHLGAVSGDARYVATMYELFADARDRRRLFDPATGLWFRDENYLFPAATTPSGKKIFWSRGNGWVFASIALTLPHLSDSPYRAPYEEMLRAMAAGLAGAQRADGLWNVSLGDPDHLPGPEASGTAFFAYGMAWGINAGVLDRGLYLPVAERAWRGLVEATVRSDGELGYVQGVGEEPASSQPVTLRSTHDYGVGAFLLAGSEVGKLGLDLGCVP